MRHATFAASLLLVLAAIGGGCAGAPTRPEKRLSALPPAERFEALVDQDPVAAAPLAHAVLDSPLTDRDTRARVMQRWNAALPGLEALRDARVADAEAFLVQGAVAAATEVIHEGLALERAVRTQARPRAAGLVARAVEAARVGAEVTAAEAGQRARAAYADGRWPDAAEAAADARRLRHRAGLPADISLTVLEGLARRQIPAEPLVPVAQVEEVPTRTATVPSPAAARRRASPRPVAAAPVVRDFVAEARRARRQDDLGGLLAALREARGAGVAGADLHDLEAWADSERTRLVSDALRAAEAAYVREDLEHARAHWERALALDPQNDRARDGLALYARFAALTR